MGKQMKDRRKKVYIDSVVQGALARRIVAHWVIFFSLVFLALPLWNMMLRMDAAPFSLLVSQSWKENAPVLVLLIAMLPIFVWDTITFSHRFAGPFHRLQKVVRDLAMGEEFQPLRVREDDAWATFAEDFNAMVERFNAQRDESPTVSIRQEDNDKSFSNQLEYGKELTHT